MHLVASLRPLSFLTLRTLFFGLCFAGTALILLSSWVYLLPNGSHPFLAERPSLVGWGLWRLSLSAHVAGGLFCLPVGLFLLSARAFAASPRLHRVLGRIYAACFVVVLFPTGIFLSFFAKGGWLTGPGFFASALFSTFALGLAIEAAWRGEIDQHRRWMLRSYAQLASAITFRIVHFALQWTEVNYDDGYVFSLWISVLGNALLAELLLVLGNKKGSKS